MKGVIGGTNLSDFLNLAATFANERATLAGRHNEAHGDRWFAGGCAVSHRGAYVLKGNIKQEGKLTSYSRCHDLFD